MQKIDRCIEPKKTIIQALKKMDVLDKKLLLVMEDKTFIGLLSSGDLQRAIINHYALDTPIKKILRKNIRIAKPEDTVDDIKNMMFEFRMELCPVVNERCLIEKVYYWEDLFGADRIHPAKQFDLPVVIMAGGLGTRLKPLTNVIPKPLIPLKDKTMLEEIFDRFRKYGSSRFYISVNYKADLIKYYINEKSFPFEPQFFVENEPMGTAGSLSLLEGKISQTFFVSNCDILIEQDYSEILDYHNENQNEITIVAAMKHYAIPYGTLVTGEAGQLLELQEKPDLTFKINSGMYILEPHLLQEIPKNTFFHITHLIEIVKNRSGKIGVFPVSEKSWKDVGQWSEYIKNIL